MNDATNDVTNGDGLDKVQEDYLAENAFQCGYCTAGMIMCTVAFLEETPKPSDDEIRAEMNRQVCRCCAYPIGEEYGCPPGPRGAGQVLHSRRAKGT